MWLFFLLAACTAMGLSCARVCRAAAAAAHPPQVTPGPAAGPQEGDRDPELTVYETAYLSGGPRRIAEVALVSMAQQRRLLLAHTGWATVVVPVGRDAFELATLAAIGDGGQRRIPAVRGELAAADEVRKLADRLVASGLALPDGARKSLSDAVRQLKGALLLVAAAAAAAVWMAPSGTDDGLLLAWFALPVILGTATWSLARGELRPYANWATTAGERLLRRVVSEEPPDGPGHAGGRRGSRRHPAPGRPSPAPVPSLLSLAVHGPAALADPALRAALHSSGA